MGLVRTRPTTPKALLDDSYVEFLVQLSVEYRMPITQLLEAMTSQELLLHQVRYSRQSIGHDREDLRMARVAQTIANYAGRSLPDGEAKPLSDFKLYGEETEAPPDEETLESKLMILVGRTASLGEASTS